MNYTPRSRALGVSSDNHASEIKRAHSGIRPQHEGAPRAGKAINHPRRWSSSAPDAGGATVPCVSGLRRVGAPAKPPYAVDLDGERWPRRWAPRGRHAELAT